MSPPPLNWTVRAKSGAIYEGRLVSADGESLTIIEPSAIVTIAYSRILSVSAKPLVY